VAPKRYEEGSLRILLINAVDPYSEVQQRWPNLGLGYLVSSIRNHFKDEFQIKISNTLDLSFHPDIVGITCVSQNYNIAKQYARAAKLAGAFVIMGGVHISSMPQTITPDMDAAVIGEGETAIIEILASLISRGPLKRYYSHPLIEPIEHIKRPARDLFKIRMQSNLFSSRGCPYRCRFCFSSRYWQKVRFFPAEYVVDELREMYHMGVRRVNFYDDLMIADLPRLEKLYLLISQDPNLSKMKFWLNARSNLVTDYTAGLMVEMGVFSVGMGLESGNPRILKYLKGSSVSVEDNFQAVRILHKHGISATASFVIGSPDETEAEIMDTYKFIEKSGLDFVDIFPLVPFPGTPVWGEAKKRNLVSDDMDWSRLNVYWQHNHNPVIMSKILSKADLDRIYAKFQRLRLKIAAKKAWFHPFFKEMIKAGSRKLFNSMRKSLCLKYQ
jgi:radical SAM superfamily enzyme YgiQ (UPF0313 family)